MTINDFTNPFFAELAVGIERRFGAAGYVAFIANTADNTVRLAEVITFMREQGVAGLIVPGISGRCARAVATPSRNAREAGMRPCQTLQRRPATATVISGLGRKPGRAADGNRDRPGPQTMRTGPRSAWWLPRAA